MDCRRRAATPPVGRGASDGRAVVRQSAGILLFRFRKRVLEILLGHPGGPYYSHRDDGAWTIPKGLLEDGEDALHAARREFAEETGVDDLPWDADEYLSLGEIRYKNGKVVSAWALQRSVDVETLVSNTFELEWPPRSGQSIEVPELDRFAYFDLGTASDKVHPAQLRFLQELNKRLMRLRTRGELGSGI